MDRMNASLMNLTKKYDVEGSRSGAMTAPVPPPTSASATSFGNPDNIIHPTLSLQFTQATEARRGRDNGAQSLSSNGNAAAAIVNNSSTQ